MTNHHRELLLHASKLLCQTGDILAELARAEKDMPEEVFYPDAEGQTILGGARRSAAADLAGRGFDPGSYVQEKTRRVFDEDGDKIENYAEQNAKAYSNAKAQSAEDETFRKTKTIEYSYDDVGRVAKSTETTRQFPWG